MYTSDFVLICLCLELNYLGNDHCGLQTYADLYVHEPYLLLRANILSISLGKRSSLFVYLTIGYLKVLRGEEEIGSKVCVCVGSKIMRS